MTKAARDRDYAAELRAAIDQYRHENDGEPPPIMAEKIVRQLYEKDPQLLLGWLELNAVSVMRDVITSIDRSQRGYQRRVAGRAVFAETATNPEGASKWLALYYTVDERSTRLPLRLMRSEHLQYVADGYTADGTTALMEAAFFRAVADRIGEDTVEQHFTEEAILRLRRSITGF